MAKKKDKKDKKADGGAKAQSDAKAKSKAKLPKRIAGVKVPKELRASGGKLMEAVRNPLVMDLAAAALLAAAAGLRERKSGDRVDGGSGSRPTGQSELGAIIAAKAIEGVRKLAAGAANGGEPGPHPRRPAKPAPRD